MNTIHLLLGLIGALLIVLLGINISGMRENSAPDQIEALRKQVEALKVQSMELDRMRLASMQQPFVNAPVNPSTVAAGNSMPVLPNMTEAAVEVDPIDEAIEDADLQALKEEVALEAAGDTNEAILADLPMIKEDPGLSDAAMNRRAKVVREALLKAKIVEVDPEDGYAAATVETDGGVQEQQVLAVRRGDGIAGRVTVSNFLSSGAVVVDPIPGSFLGGNANLVVGDELIVPPFN